jgi:hypothetical protein
VNQNCALCQMSRPLTEEHVLPRWLLKKLFPESDGPYTTDVNGETVMKRDGVTPSDSGSTDLYEFEIGGRTYRSSVNRLSVAGLNRTLVAEVVYHPGSEIAHPLSGSAGRCTLHPSDSGSFDPSQIEVDDAQSAWGWLRRVNLSPGFNPLETPWRLSSETDWLARGITGGSMPSRL